MRYALLFISFLFLPCVLYGMEMDPEATEEGKAGLDAQIERLIQALGEDSLAVGAARKHTAGLDNASRSTLETTMKQYGAGSRELYLLGELYYRSQLQLTCARESEVRLSEKLERRKMWMACQWFCVCVSTVQFIAWIILNRTSLF